jgi:hypothetical protein
MHASVKRKENGLLIEFATSGDIARVLVPGHAEPVRRPGLWEHTCFELFLRSPGQDGYFEFNFSPSAEWAAWAFDGYRSGMRALETTMPWTGPIIGRDAMQMLIFVPHLPFPPHACDVGLAAIVEDVEGEISYWALTHPSDKPDFHHPGSFALHLPGLET